MLCSLVACRNTSVLEDSPNSTSNSTVGLDWEPEVVIPLECMELSIPETIQMETFTDEVYESLKNVAVTNDSIWNGTPSEILFWKDSNHCTYAGIEPGYSSQRAERYFLKFENDAAPERIWAEEYSNICGHSGFLVSYPGAAGIQHTAYYYFDENDTLFCLLDDPGTVYPIDLDGDGQQELIWCPLGEEDQFIYLLFQFGNQLYKAEIKSLIQEAWPEVQHIGYGWDQTTHSFSLTAEVPLLDSNNGLTVTAFRQLYFDRKELRLYKDRSIYTDHMKSGLDAPAEVLAEARSFVQKEFEARMAKGYGQAENGGLVDGRVVWDDWRIIGLEGPYKETVGALDLEIWNLSYELHNTMPERVMLAGGSYLREDGWCMIGYPGCDYLYFQLDEDGRRTFLYTRMENDCSPGTERFRADIVYDLLSQEVLALSDLDGETLLTLLDVQPFAFLNFLGDEMSQAEQKQTLELLGAYIVADTDMEVYFYCKEDLSDTCVYEGELTAGGRAAWEDLQSIVDSTAGNLYEEMFTRNREFLEKAERVSEMSLSELLDFLSESDGAGTEGAVTELHQRFLAEPSAVLSAMAGREDQAQLADLLGGTIYWGEDYFPGALKQAQALELEEEQAAIRDLIVSAYETRRQEQTRAQRRQNPYT